MSSLKRGINHIKPVEVTSPSMTVTEFSTSKFKRTVKFSDEMNFGQKAQEAV